MKSTHATDIIATITRPTDLYESDWNWAEEATASWITEARKVGLVIQDEDHEVTGEYTAARVRVAGQWFELELRGDEVSAIPVIRHDLAIRRLRNLTPHPVTLLPEDGRQEVATVLESEGVARAEVRYTETTREVLGVPIVEVEYGLPIDLPEPEEGVLLVVSLLTMEAAAQSGRLTWDLLRPEKLVRGADGQIVGCEALARAPRRIS